MLVIHLAALFGILLSACCYRGFSRSGTPNTEKIFASNHIHIFLFLLLFSALLLRLTAAARFQGFGSDLACFAAWSERMHTVGASGFYSSEIFTDYPPGYMYVLGFIGWLRSAWDIPYYSVLHLVLLKLPAVICDLVCGWLLYHEASKKYSRSRGLFLCGAYLFHPVILLNSAVWGQVDSVFTLTLVLMCLALVKGRLPFAYLSFCMGVLLKPQMLIFSPVLLAGVLDQVLLKEFGLRRLLKNMLWAMLSLAALLCLCLPFGLENVWKQYFSTVASYPYAAVNACNLWGMLGLNWVSQNNTFLGIPYKLYGYFFILLIVAAVLAISLHRRNNREKYPFLGAVLILMLFVFSVRMHERYLYPGLLLLLFAFIYRPVKAVWISYGCFSVLHFYNTAYVLFFYDPSCYDPKAPFLLLVSLGMVLSAFALLCFAIPQYFASPEGKEGTSIPRQEPALRQKTAIEKKDSGHAPVPSGKSTPFRKADWICMALIPLVYGCFALYDLGDTAVPESRYDMAYGETITVNFDSSGPDRKVHTIAYYMAPQHNRNFTIETKGHPEEEWSGTQATLFSDVFTWQEIPLDTPAAYIRLRLTDNSASLLELVFLDREGNVLLPANASRYPGLFDEQTLYPARSSFRNGMYFDEIYHGRTAYEFLNGLVTYETTHPPLGKVLIAAGVALFGMNPFGWRITGTVLGIIMVPVMYLFGKRLTENTPAAFLTCVLFTFDFMHFTQTRIATIDVYITFFVLLMYFFLYRYCQIGFYDTPLSKTFLPLGACGICMGLGIACKWTGVYAGMGLAVLFFASLYRRYREYCYAKAAPTAESGGIKHSHILRVFFPYTLKTLGFCILFFVGIPALIYLLSYLPFVNASGDGLFTRMLHNQTDMYRYHSTLDASHPYSSFWYEWPIIKRPVWYYSSIVSGSYGQGGLREGISAFGNPLVWWLGIPAFFYMLYLWAKKKDRTAAFLIIGYLAQYLPWFFVTRITFIYHYFPGTVFVALIVAYSVLQLKKILSAGNFLLLTVIYGAAVFGLFLLFYPVLSGQAVDASFVEHWLRWFDGWVLTAP